MTKNQGGEDYFNELTRLILHLKLSDHNIILKTIQLMMKMGVIKL